jgi:ubiquinone/menaquinone biosynthesis C-methylase UbiE
MKHTGSEAFKYTDASSYDPVVEQFDRFTERTTRPLAARMISLARLATGQRALDVGTGTGVVALQAAAFVMPTGKVLGIDLSEGMLAVARAKAARADLSDAVEFRKMDAEALELPDCSFDAVVSLFALGHFPNPLAALREMRRVLQPGGRLVVGVGSAPALFSFNGLIHRMKRLPEVLARVQGKQLTAPAYLNHLVRKLPESDVPEESTLARQRWSKTRTILALVRAAGFVSVSSCWEGHQVVVDSPEEFWELQRTFSSLARKRLSSAPRETVAAVREEFMRTCRTVQSGGGKLVYPYAATFVAAERPGA